MAKSRVRQTKKNKPRARKFTQAKYKRANTYKSSLVQFLQSGGGLKGFRLNKKGDITIHYQDFADVFPNQKDFSEYFQNILKPGVSLQTRVNAVEKAWSHFQPKHQQEAEAYKGALASYQIRHFGSMKYPDIEKFFREVKDQFVTILSKSKFRVTFDIRLLIGITKWTVADGVVDGTKWLTTQKIKIWNRNDFNREYSRVAEYFYGIFSTSNEVPDSEGSGWRIDKILKCYMNVISINPIKGKKYFPITNHTNPKCGLINIKNDDEYCLLWCITAHLHPMPSHKNETYSYKQHFYNYLEIVKDFDEDYEKYEDTFGINLMIYEVELTAEGEQDEIYRVYGGKRDQDNLLVYRNKLVPIYQDKNIIKVLRAIRTNEDGTKEGHYALINNMDHLLSKQAKCGRNTSYAKICPDCLRSFYSKERYEAHCGSDQCQEDAVIYEVGKPCLQSKTSKRPMPINLVVYADFEAMNIPMNEEKGDKSTIIGKQQTCSYAFTVIKTNDSENLSDCSELEDGFHLKCGQDGERVAMTFLQDLIEYCDSKYDLIRENVPMKELTDQQKYYHNRATLCKECGEPFQHEWKQNKFGRWVPGRLTKVRHHDHKNGKYLGAVHNKCNLQMTELPQVVVIFHNLTGYDSHDILCNLCESFGVPKIIANNSESIKALQLKRSTAHSAQSEQRNWIKYQIKFIDSFAFKKASLEKLFTGLDVSKRILTSNYLDPICGLSYEVEPRGNKDPVFRNQLEACLKKHIIMGKNAFPYEYLDSYAKFYMPLFPWNGKFALTPEDFRSSLKEGDQHLSEQCRHMETVCRLFNYTCFQDYHDLYLTLDIKMLADVFQNFRAVSMQAKNCGLDPCHYYGIPSLAYASMLKFNKTTIELFQGVDQYRMFREQGMRGGISCWMQYYAKANNKLHPEYDPNQPTSYILDQDCTSLYPWAARMFTPIGKYFFTTEFNCTDFDTMFKMIDVQDHSTGYYFWVDIHLPETVEGWNVPDKYKQANWNAIVTHFGGNLHDYNAGYPPLVEKKTITFEMLSKRQQEIYGDSFTPAKNGKLICDLLPKDCYMIHYLTLRQALELGWVITKIHKYMSFQQGQPLKEYIDECVDLRSHAKNSEEKDLHKLIPNSMIGKTIEDVEAYSNFDITTSYKQFLRSYSNNKIKDFKILSDHDVVMVNKYPKKYVLDKPIMLGISVYDNSKILMTALVYKLVNKYGKNLQILGTDTDSLIFKVFTEDWNTDVEEFNIDSLFSEDHPYYHVSRFSDKKDAELRSKGINPLVGIFDCGEKYLTSVPGFFKPDCNNIIEQAAMRSKQYALKIAHDELIWIREEDKWVSKQIDFKSICKSKGVPSKYVKEHFHFEMYKDLVLGDGPKSNQATFTGMRSIDHQVHTIRMSKTGLKAVDDKRFSIDGIHTLPFGHMRIKDYQ